MNQIFIYVALVLFGVIVGSFNGATVWRLRARQLREDKKAGEKVKQSEYTQLEPLLKTSLSRDRSMCLHCHHKLAWYDLLPLVSWMMLRGKCRYCHKQIGAMEPLIEVGTALFLVLSYALWPIQLATPIALIHFGLWLIVGNGLILLFAYDLRWFLLPNRLVFPLVGLAGINAVAIILSSTDKMAMLWSGLLSCLILSGLYYILHVTSHGKWVGFGDVKLGLVLALMLMQWPLAFFTLFLANLIGCFVVLPGLFTKKLTRTSQVPFGPMLISAYFIVGLCGPAILMWYFMPFAL